jgi:hypothetical protein
VRADVVVQWKKQKGAELAAAAAAQALKRLTAGETWEAVAKSLNVAVQPAKFVARADQSVPMDIRRAGFEAPKPLAKPVYEKLALPDGDAAVVAVTALREDPTAPPQEQEAQMRRQLAQQAAAGEAQGYAAAARADAKVILNAQALD